MSTQRWKTVVAAVAVLAIPMVGCGSDDDDEGGGAGSGTAKEASTSATSKLAGDYRRKVTSADIARTDRLRQEAGPNQEAPEPGPAALTLKEGTLKFTDVRADLTILQDYSATSDGAFRIGAYQRPEEGSFCGPDIAQTASYTWSLDGDVLTLKAKQDPCADRDSSLSGSWKRG